ncbi:hypothetical protein QTH97_30935 [Variovorax sp. J22R24]|uniref:hypothetical protein n=1 Tax=Variovorax gracilis TaxID=3053502 RepID=UPI0025763C13|nr:hypothetical protein [Variovorax sp. J22R24]MDM0109377.1 hypothetical protein [Variovorax sp. J22R24]
MNRCLWVTAALAWALVLESAQAGSTFWPGSMGQQEAGMSGSPVKAPIPATPISPPGPEAPESHARWSGLWTGWMARNRQLDVNIAVTAISPEKVDVVYAVASARIAPTESAAEGKFVDNELQALLPSGALLIMRMVTPERVEISYDGSKLSGGTCCTFGVLTRKP